MTNLPPIPKGRDWSEATWRAGLDEAVRRDGSTSLETWSSYCEFSYDGRNATIAHATTLLDAGIVKPVVSEGAALLESILIACYLRDNPAAIAVIQAALYKAMAGE